MSERTIRRSVFANLAVAIGLGGMFSHRNVEGAASTLDDNKQSRFRNNYTQKADAKVKKVDGGVSEIRSRESVAL